MAAPLSRASRVLHGTRWAAAFAIWAGACASEWERDDLEGRPCPCLADWVCDTSRGPAGICVAKGAGLAGSGGNSGATGGGAGGAGSGGAGSGGPPLADAGVEGPGQCPPLDGPSGASCPSICDECTNDACIIRCDAARACNATTLECPAGFDCEIACASDDSCATLEVACADGHACSTRCEGRRSCRAVNIACGSGPCALSCAAGAQICRDGELHCGTGSCQATCQGNETPLVVGCESSCSPSCGC